MEYLQKCFYKETNWNEDNIFPNITATSLALLDSPIPNGSKLEVSSKATPHLALSITLTNKSSINGSLAYLYSSVPLKNAAGTKDVSLQDAISGFRVIEPYYPGSSKTKPFTGEKPSLYYGRMYFPGSALEAMIIKRISEQTQILLKCISNPRITRDGTMIMYIQRNTPRFSLEYIFSTNEALFGFRCLYNFGNSRPPSTTPLIPKFDNSVVSIGTELWYAARSMSPGLSSALRYSTRSTSTGKPLTMTLSCNPILGHVSSTYNVKTSVASTVCSKYDFNWFSYASNLSVGFELYNFAKQARLPSTILPNNLSLKPYSIHHDKLAPIPDFKETLLERELWTTGGVQTLQKDQRHTINKKPPQSYFTSINHPSSRQLHEQELHHQSVITAFQKMLNESNFSSVLRGSMSFSDRMVKLLWVGRYKDFLVNTGVKLNLNQVTSAPEISRFGISFSYAC